MRALLHAFGQSFQRWNRLRDVSLHDDELSPLEYDMQAINERFYKAMGRTNRTRTEIAEYLGLDPKLPLSMQPKEKIPRPTMESIIKVSMFLGVSVGWMLNGIPENDVDLFVESTPAKINQSFSAHSSAIVQGNEQSTIIVNNNSLDDHEKEIIRLYRSLPMQEQVKLLTYAYELTGCEESGRQSDRRCPLSQEVAKGH